jgi:hypothetical protein
VGALLGYAQATDKRCIACIGDGSFQVKYTLYFDHYYKLLLIEFS